MLDDKLGSNNVLRGSGAMSGTVTGFRDERVMCESEV
jgi:hypothetical protein